MTYSAKEIRRGFYKRVVVKQNVPGLQYPVDIDRPVMVYESWYKHPGDIWPEPYNVEPSEEDMPESPEEATKSKLYDEGFGHGLWCGSLLTFSLTCVLYLVLSYFW